MQTQSGGYTLSILSLDLLDGLLDVLLDEAGRQTSL
jgi:hypothetical protein